MKPEPYRRKVSRILGWPELKITGLCLTIFCFLQFFRKCYFLTDDNLDGWLPVAVEMGRRLFELKNPFLNDYLYGGVDFSNDPGILSMCNPLTPVISILALTRFYYWMADAAALFHLVAGAIFFYRMSRCLQNRFGLDLTSASSYFLALSWAFSVYSLTVGSSWMVFLGNMAALPLLVWGIVHPRAGKSMLLIFLGAAYSIFAGHLHPFLYSEAFLTLIVAAMALRERSWALMVRWLAAHVMVLVLALPILLPGLMAVLNSDRVELISIHGPDDLNVPMLITAASMLVGPFTLLGQVPLDIFRISPAWSESFAFSASSFCFLAVLWQSFKSKFRLAMMVAGVTLVSYLWQPAVYVLILVPLSVFLLLAAWSVFCGPKTSGNEKFLMALILGLVLLIQRPEFLTAFLNQIPVYRMLQWPFRENLQLVFFIHLFLCFKIGTLSTKRRFFCGTAGVVMMLLMVAVGTDGSALNPMSVDRKLIMSGEAEAWWEKNKAIDGGEPWIAVIDKIDSDQTNYDTPFSLLGAYNYPSLFRVKSAAGYWATWLPLGKKLQEIKPYHISGILTQENADRLKTLKKVQYAKARLLKGGEWIEVRAFGEKGENSVSVNVNELKK